MNRRAVSMTVLAAVALLFSVSASHAEPAVDMLANTCAVCHGTDGRSPGSIENLYQTAAAEFVEEMMEFKYKDGEGRIMGPIARGFSDEQIRGLGGYFAALGR